jgi:hypothetical protein
MPPPNAHKPLRLADIARRIDAHLKALEADPVWNTLGPKHGHLQRFWHASAWAMGRYIGVTYVSYQNHSALSKTEALEYLAWLDAGNKGSHHIMQHKIKRTRKEI